MNKIQQSPLPYKLNELIPFLSEEALQFHYGKHHLAYVNNTNKILDELKQSSHINHLRSLSFNLNGHILHELYFSKLKKPTENNLPTEELLELINENYKSFENFKIEFSDTAKGIEGSGWAVLMKKDNDLVICPVEKHNYNLIAGFEPILCIDVWEHAYYIDYRNDRGKYIEEWWKAVKW